jgi:hypothetical protein
VEVLLLLLLPPTAVHQPAQQEEEAPFPSGDNVVVLDILELLLVSAHMSAGITTPTTLNVSHKFIEVK